MLWIFRISCITAVGLWIAVSSGVTSAAGPRVEFNRQIRPILSDHCFQCHGPDQAHREGGLRLDLPADAAKGGDSGPAIVPGQVEASEVWKRITSSDPDLRMPPPQSGKELKPEQIELIQKWIAEGAEYQGHWAFQPVVRPAVPTIEGVSNPIDLFVREKLQQLGRTPSPEAPRETLIRRVTLDLTGLPPTLAEIEDYLADTSPQAYERVVDRLLTSPHYGERMTQQWLDFARYADSNGFQVDSSRQMFEWRDWVINAFNRNLPYDQFTIEQLAGDMLPQATRDQIIASGFNRNTRLNGEGGRIAEEWFAETVIDRVETTGLTWMALTLNCCRCHDHKYDPITQREFYQLFAFFNSVDESGVLDVEGGNSRPTLKLPTPENEKRLAELKSEVAKAETQVADFGKTFPKRQAEWEQEFASQLTGQPQPWNLLSPESVRSAGGATFTKLPDQSWLASGVNPANDEYTLSAPLRSGSFTGLLLEAFPDPSLPNQSLGRYENGNFVLTDIDAIVSAPSLAAPVKADITRAESDYDQSGWPVKAIVEDKAKRQGKNTKGWAVDGPSKREPRTAMFVFSTPIVVPENATVTVVLKHDAIGGHNIGRFRISATGWLGENLSLQGASIPDSLRKAITTERPQRTAEQAMEIENYFRKHADTQTKQAEQVLTAAKKAASDYEAKIPSVMVMQELATPRDAFILNRGQYDQPGDKVTRGVPASLPPLPADVPVNRLGFAQWLVSREHPLTARVWVNRAWERFFGNGLVRTTENLGSQSEWPSHLELLDWLAAEFMEPSVLPPVAGQPAVKWDMKALQKLIVMSATYRQSAAIVSPDDPENRLLSRGPRFRLSAEAARDQALSLAGLLVPKIGGPSVRPYMPEGVWDETSRYGDLRGYKADTGEGLYRRSLYTIWKRTAPPPSMTLFDSPAREVCTVKRSRTNTPLQALALLNEVTYTEAARKVGERMIRDGGSTPSERLRYGFRLATGRLPHEDELAVLLDGWNADMARFQVVPESARQYLAVGVSQCPVDLDPVQLAAYALSANVLLNLDEVITRE
ncbi:MAG: PSD1 and planctomycete cytochrome C domain-containing protein [Planctomycetaceae bacterium]